MQLQSAGGPCAASVRFDAGANDAVKHHTREAGPWVRTGDHGPPVMGAIEMSAARLATRDDVCGGEIAHAWEQYELLSKRSRLLLAYWLIGSLTRSAWSSVRRRGQAQLEAQRVQSATALRDRMRVGRALFAFRPDSRACRPA